MIKICKWFKRFDNDDFETKAIYQLFYWIIHDRVMIYVIVTRVLGAHVTS